MCLREVVEKEVVDTLDAHVVPSRIARLLASMIHESVPPF
jgi:hypothetical protein